MHSFGNAVRIHLFGKSHAPAVGCILEGIPAGVLVSSRRIAADMALRKPSKGIGTLRSEPDEVKILSGICDENPNGTTNGITNGITNGMPIVIFIENKNTDSSAYEKFRTAPRPGHADMPALIKDSGFDIRGGGQFSGRMTAPIVAAGSIARQFLETKGIQIAAFTKSVGNVHASVFESVSEPVSELVSESISKSVSGFISDFSFEDAQRSISFKTRAPNDESDKLFEKEILAAASESDSVGGIIECRIKGIPAGFGGIWFEAIDCELAHAAFGIPAVKGIEFGKGFGLSKMKGSESNDAYILKNGKIETETNNMGGILGGMSNGSEIIFRVVVKPTPSIGKEQKTVNPETLEETSVIAAGRHDPCIVPRAVAVVEAMAALVVADQIAREPVFKEEFCKENRCALPDSEIAGIAGCSGLDSVSVSVSDSNSAELENLRCEIAAADREILEAMKKRMLAAEKIGRLKSGRGLPVRNPEVESRVIERCRKISEELNLNPDDSEAVFKILIQSSVNAQNQLNS